MKKIATTLLCAAMSSTCLFAQWNESGSNKSAGGLSVNNGVFTTSRSGVRVSGEPINSGASLRFITSSDSLLMQLSSADDVFSIYRSGAYSPKSLFITKDGELGIGTRTPRGKLDVNGSMYTGAINIANSSFVVNNKRIELTYPESVFLNFKSTTNDFDARIFLHGTNGNLVLENKNIGAIYITPQRNVGIGVATPTAKLDVNGNAQVSGSLNGSNGVFATNPYGIRIATQENRSPQLKIAAASDSVMLTLDRADGTLKLLRYIDGAARTHMFFTKDQKVGIMNATPTAALDVKGNIKASELSVAGTIYAKSVKVRVDAGADYVFDADYKLRDLSEVEAFFKENRHLPEIQSEKDMRANGVDMNEFQIKLLQKVEELTLYVIQQNKRIEELETALENK